MRIPGGIMARIPQLYHTTVGNGRFVGLLLATKLLQSSDRDDAIREVMGALGPKFINRLLLPLTRQRQVGSLHT